MGIALQGSGGRNGEWTQNGFPLTNNEIVLKEMRRWRGRVKKLAEAGSWTERERTLYFDELQMPVPQSDKPQIQDAFELWKGRVQRYLQEMPGKGELAQLLDELGRKKMAR